MTNRRIERELIATAERHLRHMNRVRRHGAKIRRRVYRTMIKVNRERIDHIRAMPAAIADASHQFDELMRQIAELEMRMAELEDEAVDDAEFDVDEYDLIDENEDENEDEDEECEDDIETLVPDPAPDLPVAIVHLRHDHTQPRGLRGHYRHFAGWFQTTADRAGRQLLRAGDLMVRGMLDVIDHITRKL